MYSTAPTAGVETATAPPVEPPRRRRLAKLRARIAQVSAQFDYRFSFLYGGVFALYFYITYNQAFSPPPAFNSDLPQHIAFANQFFSGQLGISYPGLYVLWFIVSWPFGMTIAQGAVVVDALLAVAVTAIIRKALELCELSVAEQFIYTVVLMVVTPIFDPFFNPSLQLGQISANIYHNPTLLGLKPFAYLSLLLFVRWIHRGHANGIFALAALSLLVSTVMKPNFILAFAPALVMYLLLKSRRFEHWWKTAAALLITCAALAVQYVITYQQPGDTSHIGISILGVWKLFSPNPLVSILVSLAFPLCILVFRWRQALRNDYLLLSWLTLGIAIAQFAFLAEDGARFGHGNLGWGMQSAIPMVFLFSIVEWVRWIRDEKVNPKLAWAVALTGLVLSLHFFSGAFYLVQIATGHNW